MLWYTVSEWLNHHYPPVFKQGTRVEQWSWDDTVCQCVFVTWYWDVYWKWLELRNIEQTKKINARAKWPRQNSKTKEFDACEQESETWGQFEAIWTIRPLLYLHAFCACIFSLKIRRTIHLRRVHPLAFSLAIVRFTFVLAGARTWSPFNYL